MRPDLFIQYLQTPEQISAEQLCRLEEVMRAYPCFAAAKELYLKALHQSKDLSYEAALFKTSLASPHRQRLFAYIQALDVPTVPQDLADTDSTAQAFDLIDTFLGDAAIDEPVETPDQALESLQKLYVTYHLEAQDASQASASESQPRNTELLDGESGPEISDNANNSDSLDNANSSNGSDFSNISDNSNGSKQPASFFESPLIQAFIEHPQEEIAPASTQEDESDLASDVQSDYESAWESLPTDSLTLTLVKIYLKQKKYERALEILKTLALNNPEKSVYFADQIRFLEKLLTHLNK